MQLLAVSEPIACKEVRCFEVYAFSHTLTSTSYNVRYIVQPSPWPDTPHWWRARTTLVSGEEGGCSAVLADPQRPVMHIPDQREHWKICAAAHICSIYTQTRVSGACGSLS